MVDLRINETRQTGAGRKTKLPFYRWVGAVSNCAYAGRFVTAPTGGRKCSFIFNIHYKFGSYTNHYIIGGIKWDFLTACPPSSSLM